MGITRAEDGGPASRFAAITNIRAPAEHRDDAPSRGKLVADFLAGSMTPEEYVAQIRPQAEAYNGFNLVLSDGQTLIWYSNRGDGDARNGKPLEPGVYGLSNALLDAPWPKVVKTKAQFASLLCLGAPDEAYFEMLSDTTQAPDMRACRKRRVARRRAHAVGRTHRKSGLRHPHFHRGQAVRQRTSLLQKCRCTRLTQASHTCPASGADQALSRRG
jgi:hypothetical protein